MISSILLQAAGGSGAMGQLIMILMIIVIFYFFMIRPQMKKAKVEKAFKESLNKGDKIVTIGGIHGRILEVAETTFMVEIDSNVKVKLEKSAVSAEATKIYQPKKDAVKS
ncbi:MAG TPA: preprotein translocase subunit YajC [Bacteroidia bacterium]|nr:preprotein translocase subunit YajC [Bacteroidia bacterium]